MNTALQADNQSGTEVGVISEVHGPVVIITCETLPPLRQALYTITDDAA